jgi:hypothetical protein
MLGTKLCDRCWELETRITGDPVIARKILASLNEPNLLLALHIAGNLHDASRTVNGQFSELIDGLLGLYPVSPNFSVAVFRLPSSVREAFMQRGHI